MSVYAAQVLLFLGLTPTGMIANIYHAATKSRVESYYRRNFPQEAAAEDLRRHWTDARDAAKASWGALGVQDRAATSPGRSPSVGGLPERGMVEDVVSLLCGGAELPDGSTGSAGGLRGGGVGVEEIRVFFSHLLEAVVCVCTCIKLYAHTHNPPPRVRLAPLPRA